MSWAASTVVPITCRIYARWSVGSTPIRQGVSYLCSIVVIGVAVKRIFLSNGQGTDRQTDGRTDGSASLNVRPTLCLTMIYS